MDVVLAQKLRKRYFMHQVIAAMGVVIGSHLILGHADPGIAALFVIVMLIVFVESLVQFHRYHGYGVAGATNRVLGENVFDVHDLTLGRSITKHLFIHWRNRGILYAVLIATLSLVDHFYPSQIIGFLITLIFALSIVLGARVYLWFAIERKRLWYPHEEFVRLMLRARHWNRGGIERAIEELKKEKLIVYGVPFP